ncbi:unnamed protein product, partial [Chrysoparadoxa australica]
SNGKQKAKQVSNYHNTVYKNAKSKVGEIQERYEPCKEGCPCDSADNCHCMKIGGFCDKYCGCYDEVTKKGCNKMFKGCKCGSGKHSKTSCSTRHCPCRCAGRECIPEICTNCCGKKGNECLNKGLQEEGQRTTRRGDVYAKKSNIERAGDGAFAAKPFRKGELIMEYFGRILTEEESIKEEQRAAACKNNYLFRMNKEQTIDARDVSDCTIRFANHDDENANCEPAVMIAAGKQHVALYAKEAIEHGDELLFDYGECGPLKNHVSDYLSDASEDDDASEDEDTSEDEEAGEQGVDRDVKVAEDAERALVPAIAPKKPKALLRGILRMRVSENGHSHYYLTVALVAKYLKSFPHLDLTELPDYFTGQPGIYKALPGLDKMERSGDVDELPEMQDISIPPPYIEDWVKLFANITAAGTKRKASSPGVNPDKKPKRVAPRYVLGDKISVKAEAWKVGRDRGKLSEYPGWVIGLEDEKVHIILE